MAEAKQKELEEYISALEKMRSQNSSIQKQLLEKSESLSQLQGLLSQKEENLSELQKLLDQKISVLANLQGQLGKLNLSSLGDATGLANLKAQINSKNAALRTKDATIASKDAALKEKDDQITELMKQIEMLKKGGIPGLGGAGGFLKK